MTRPQRAAEAAAIAKALAAKPRAIPVRVGDVFVKPGGWTRLLVVAIEGDRAVCARGVRVTRIKLGSLLKSFDRASEIDTAYVKRCIAKARGLVSTPNVRASRNGCAGGGRGGVSR